MENHWNVLLKSPQMEIRCDYITCLEAIFLIFLDLRKGLSLHALSRQLSTFLMFNAKIKEGSDSLLGLLHVGISKQAKLQNLGDLWWKTLCHFISASFKTLWFTYCIYIIIFVRYQVKKIWPSEHEMDIFLRYPEIPRRRTPILSISASKKSPPGNWVSAVHEQSRCRVSDGEIDKVPRCYRKIANNIIPSHPIRSRNPI